MQDVEVLVHMARRRCTDDKAAVRKAGLQLLEALLMMRARGAGGADVELPAEQDIRALEAATADALVCPAFLCCFSALLHAAVAHCLTIHLASGAQVIGQTVHNLAGEHSVSLHLMRAF